VVVLAIWVASR